MKVLEFIATMTDDCLIAVRGYEDGSMRHLLTFFKDKTLEITVKVYKKNRSDAQNRYMWGVIVPAIKDWFLSTQGEKHTKDEVYVWIRMSLLDQTPTVKTIMGIEVITIESKRFSEMTTEEFANAVDLIIQRMAERGLYIPLPKEGNHINHYITNG